MIYLGHKKKTNPITQACQHLDILLIYCVWRLWFCGLWKTLLKNAFENP